MTTAGWVIVVFLWLTVSLMDWRLRRVKEERDRLKSQINDPTGKARVAQHLASKGILPQDRADSYIYCNGPHFPSINVSGTGFEFHGSPLPLLTCPHCELVMVLDPGETVDECRFCGGRLRWEAPCDGM